MVLRSSFRAGPLVFAWCLAVVVVAAGPRSATAAVLTASQASVAPGASITIQVTGGPGGRLDWVGLYQVGAPGGSFGAWLYLNASQSPPASGRTSATLVFVAPTSTGSYEARLYANGSTSDLRATRSFSVGGGSGSTGSTSGATGPTLTLSPATPAPGATLTVQVAGGPGGPLDRVGLYPVGGAGSAPITWLYLNASQSPPATGRTSATLIFAAPTSTGSYEARLYANGSTSDLRATRSFSVGGGSGSTGSTSGATGPTLTLSPATPAPGATLTVQVAGGPGGPLDRVGLYPVGGAGSAPITWLYLNASQSPPATGRTSATLIFVAPTSTGSYEARLYANGSTSDLRATRSFSVGGGSGSTGSTSGATGPTLTLSPATPAPGATLTVQVAGGPGGPLDRVGLYPVGGAGSAPITWLYLNASQSPPATGRTSATLVFVAPTSTGSYEARLYANGSTSDLRATRSFSVGGGSGSTGGTSGATGPTLTLSPATPAPGATLTVQVAGGPGGPLDRVGLYPVGGAGSAPITWLYLNASQSPPATGRTSATLVFVAPTSTGSYEARLYANGSTSDLRATRSFSVSGSTSAPSSPAPPPSESPPPTGQAAELPRSYVDTTLVPPTGRTIDVPAGGSFQAALNTAQSGDVIQLQAGATYMGTFMLPFKTGSGWITIRTSTPDGQFPPPGTRVTPADAAKMPKVLGPTNHSYGPAIATAPGAHHYRFIGIEFGPVAGATPYDLVAIGYTETNVADVPHHIILDRVYVHGSPTLGGKRGIVLHGAHVAVIDSHLADWKLQSTDTQAMAGWNGPGPFKIANNHIEAAAENVMFGGARPSISGMIPADIEIVGNLFTKPLAWQSAPWSIKNLIEFKSGRRIWIHGNIFENVWASGQAGYAFMFSPRADSGAWAAVTDVTITSNLIRRTGAGFAISGFDPGATTERGGRYYIADNLLLEVGGPYGSGILTLIVNGARDVVFEHNTSMHSGEIIRSDTSSEANPGLVFRDNVTLHNSYGVFAGGVGDYTLDRCFPNNVFVGNVIIGPWPTPGGGTPAHYAGHPGNFFPNSVAEVGFVNPTAGDYTLSSSSPYRGAGSDGNDPGIE